MSSFCYKSWPTVTLIPAPLYEVWTRRMIYQRWAEIYNSARVIPPGELWQDVGKGLVVRAEGSWGVWKVGSFPCNPPPLPVGSGPFPPITQTICLLCSNYKPSSLQANRRRGSVMMETFITIYHNSSGLKQWIYVRGYQYQRPAKQPGGYYFMVSQGLLVKKIIDYYWFLINVLPLQGNYKPICCILFRNFTHICFTRLKTTICSKMKKRIFFPPFSALQKSFNAPCVREAIPITAG